MNDQQRELKAAVNALSDWFLSQEISMQDAIPILGTMAIYIIFTLAKASGTDPEEGLEAFIEGQREQLKQVLEGLQ